MSETLLVLLISLAFGGLVFYFSTRYEKVNGVKINAKLWGAAAFTLVWAIWFLTEVVPDIGSK